MQTALLRLFIESLQRCRGVAKIQTGSLEYMYQQKRYEGVAQEKRNAECFLGPEPLGQDDLEDIVQVCKEVMKFMPNLDVDSEKERPIAVLALAMTTISLYTALGARSASFYFKI